MTEQHSDVQLLQDPVAVELLGSRELARFAYTWTDGAPRVVPLWFHWTGSAITFGTPTGAPKLKVLEQRPDVAVTIDSSSTWPYRALLLRGTAAVEMLDRVSDEYVASAHRYFGEEQGEAWVKGLREKPMARILMTPTKVSVLDFETRFPSALSA